MFVIGLNELNISEKEVPSIVKKRNMTLINYKPAILLKEYFIYIR